MDAQARAARILDRALKLVPNETHFTFSKLWIAIAQLHIRRKDL